MNLFFKSLTILLAFSSAHGQSNFMHKVYNFKDTIKEKPYYSIEQALSVSGFNQESLILDQKQLEDEFIYDTSIKSKGNSVPIDAIQFIKKEAKKNNVIIINEAHNKPNHRIFINKMLIELAGDYSFYLPETFISPDCQIQQALPKLCPKYTFSNEPNFAKIFRSALKLNYKILPYESINDSCFHFIELDTIVRVEYNCNGKIEFYNFKIADYKYSNFTKREIIQAINLKRIISNFPNKKFIIHCGYAHGSYEKPYMAYFLNKLGINFLSIDQTYFNESSKPINYIKEYSENINRTSPYILINSKDSSAIKFTKSPPIIANYYIFHPPTKYIANRPTWLKQNKSIVLSQINQLFPKNNSKKNLFITYFAHEYDVLGNNAIPYDIIEQNETQQKVSSYFEKYVVYYIFRRSLNNKIDKIEFKVDF